MQTPLDRILSESNLSNHALVEAYGPGLSHKTVQKARTGSRPLSKHMQTQIVDALNKAAQPEVAYKRLDLFPASASDLPAATDLPPASDSEG